MRLPHSESDAATAQTGGYSDGSGCLTHRIGQFTALSVICHLARRFVQSFLSRQYFDKPIDFLKVPSGAIFGWTHDYLKYRVWACGQTPDIATVCLKFAYERALAAKQANTFEQVTTGASSHPWGKRSFLQAKILLDALYQKKLMNQADAVELAAIEAQLAPHTSPAYWDGTAQGGYQFAIDLLLLTEAWPQAQSMVDNARGMRTLNVKEPFRAAKLICKHKGSVADQAKAKLAYQQTFDALRNPDLNSRPRGQDADLLSMFVMACIWQKFFEPGQGEYDYDKAIDLIWA